MLERTIKEAWTLEDVTELQSRLSRMTHETNKPLYQQCKVWVEDAEARRKARAEAKERGEEVPELGEGDGEDIEELPFGQGDFGYRFNMDKAIKTLSEKELYNRVVCSKCADFPENAHKTDVGVLSNPSFLHTNKKIVRTHLLLRLHNGLYPRPNCQKRQCRSLPLLPGM
jgi:hypothetical protein